MSHRNLGRATRGCRSYSCGCRATLCNEIFNLASKFQSHLKFSILIFRIPTKIGIWRVARLNNSISLENFKILKLFSIFGPLKIGYSMPCRLKISLHHSLTTERGRCQAQRPNQLHANSSRLLANSDCGTVWFLKRALAQTCLRAWYQVRFFSKWGAPGTVSLHDLGVPSQVLQRDVPLGWYQVRFF